MLRNFGEVPYIPILALRPAEMNALEELPAGDLDALLPLIMLKPWLSANLIDNCFSRLVEAYGDRPVIVNLSHDAAFTDKTPRQVHNQFGELLLGQNGYDTWCQLIEAHPNMIPSIQYERLNHVAVQIPRLAALNRGVVVHIRREALANAIVLVEQFRQPLLAIGNSLLIVLDYGQQRANLLNTAAETIGLIQTLTNRLPACQIAIAATTFPMNFGNLTSQNIYERQFHTMVQQAFNDRQILYADRGSARAEAMSGGSRPKPRIDLPTQAEWQFFREDIFGYQEAAERAMASDYWDSNLLIWGTQMIERTALGADFAINTPAKSTAARINIHLHRQLFFDSPQNMYNTDEEWNG